MNGATILDDILGRSTAYAAGPEVISENHDAGSINWVGGVTDPGEMIGCGRYQELRRHAGEADEAYQERLVVLLAALPAEHRHKIESSMKAAALERAGLDTSNGRVNVMVAGAEAVAANWHKLGVSVREAVNSVQAAELAGLLFRVEKQAMAYRGKGGVWVESDDTFSLVRADTHAKLGTVGSVYQPIQNADGFGFLDAVLGQYGARYSSAGSVHGGKKVWMQVELPKLAFEAARGDEVYATAIFTNPHDGSGKAFCYPTNVRAVCHNTLRRSLGDRDKGIGMRHTGDIKARIADAQAALGLAVRGFEEFKDNAAVLVRTPVVAERYFADLLDAALDVTEAQARAGAAVLAQNDFLAGVVATTEARMAAEKKYQRAINDRGAILDDIIARYESERCGVGGIRGTAWAALNAVTESADHGKLGQPGRRVGSREAQESRRFESLLAGDADQIKQTAFRMAVALAG